MAAPIIPIGSYDPTQSNQANMQPDDTEAPDVLLSLYDCDVCGFTFRRNQLQKRWDGLLVCKADFEEKHPREEAMERGGNPLCY